MSDSDHAGPITEALGRLAVAIELDDAVIVDTIRSRGSQGLLLEMSDGAHVNVTVEQTRSPSA
jgi:hypothetical protein